MITREDIIFCYDYFLQREPENESVITEKLNTIKDCGELIKAFTNSQEYAEKHGSVFYMPPMQIKECKEGQKPQLFRRVQAEWETLGETQPFWSVLSWDEYKAENFDVGGTEAFFRSGEKEIDMIEATLRRNKIIKVKDELKEKIALELGCGVGRVTTHLGKVFKQVYGVDISQGNLDVAKKHVGENVELIKVNQLEQYYRLPNFDFVYSTMVLQHNCPPVMEYVIDIVLSKLRENGIAMLQMPTYKRGYRWNYDEYMNTPEQMEMHILPQSTMFKIIEKNDCMPLEVAPFDCTGNNDNSMMYVIIKRSQVK